MSVGALQNDGDPGRRRVEISAGREARFRPMRFDPAAPHQHVAVLHADGARLHGGGEFGDRTDGVEIEGQLTGADAAHMDVGIRKPGKRRRAAQIENFGVRSAQPRNAGAHASVDDDAVLDRERRDRTAAGLAGIDGAAPEDEVGRLRLGVRDGGQKERSERGDEKGKAHHPKRLDDRARKRNRV